MYKISWEYVDNRGKGRGQTWNLLIDGNKVHVKNPSCYSCVFSGQNWTKEEYGMNGHEVRYFQNLALAKYHCIQDWFEHRV